MALTSLFRHHNYMYSRRWTAGPVSLQSCQAVKQLELGSKVRSQQLMLPEAEHDHLGIWSSTLMGIERNKRGPL